MKNPLYVPIRKRRSGEPIRLFSPRLGALFLLAVFIFLAACSETTVDVAETGGFAPGDTSLPNGFVADNRPAMPALSFTVPCPLGVVPDGVDNPNVTLGCPVIDCIGAVDNPEFSSVKDAKIVGFERIVAIELDGQVKGIPIRILIHHEVVNICWDYPDGSTKYSAITYCPIVEVTAHFLPTDFDCDDPGKNIGYGVSSGLYNGDLIVYRRGTGGEVHGSYVQVYGGGLHDGCLEIERVNNDMPASLFQRLYPKAEILTENTGFFPAGGYDLFDHPYAEWWLRGDLCVNGLCFPVSSTDDRLPLKVYVYGVFTPAEPKAFLIDGFNVEVINDMIGGIRTVVFHELGATVAYEAVVDGQELTFAFLDREANALPLYKDEETGSLWTFDGISVRGPLKGRRLAQIVGYRAFWFAWSAFFPGTSVHEFDDL